METDIFSEMLWIESVSREEKILVLTQKLVPFSEVNHKRNHASVCTKDLLYKQLLDVFCIIFFFIHRKMFIQVNHYKQYIEFLEIQWCSVENTQRTAMLYIMWTRISGLCMGSKCQ